MRVVGAIAFLTRVPVDRDGVASRQVGAGAIWFPVVGAGVGAATALTGWALALLLPAAVAATMAVGAGVLLTGALHLDGLADTADGYGAATRGRALEIMRDHAHGTYGVAAIALDLGLRVALIAALLPHSRGLLWLVTAGALSRAVALALGGLLPGARAGSGDPEDRGAAGQAAVLDGVGRSRVALAVIVGVAIAVLAGGAPGLLAAIAVAAAAALWGRHCLRRLGGVTGDTLGAASEGAELLTLVLGVALGAR